MAGTTEHCGGEDIDANAEMIGSTEHSDGEDVDADVDMAGATEHVEAEQETINPDDEKDSIPMAEEMTGSTERPDGKNVDADVDMAGAAEHAETEQETIKPDDKATDREDDTKAPPQIFQLTISLRDDWLHRGDALQDMDLQTYAEFIERRAKPIRGADTKKILTQPTFAFDAHYKMAPGFMQAFRPSHLRCLARFNVPNCLRESVNEGEENAQFKAFHCSLIRCPGVGMCADPLMCAPTVFPNSKGVYRYRPAWRARQAETLALAMTGYEKKMKARRFETLHDTTLWKVYKPTRVLQSTEFSHADTQPEEDTPESKALRRMLQIDIQRWIRSMIRYLRENAPAESPCNYGYADRIIHRILSFLGCPLWHDDQLHLSEWQALQQLEYLFNLTLTVDAKNIALEKLKAHKKRSSVHAETTDLPEPINRLRNIDDEELQDAADADLIMDELPEDEKKKGAVLPVTDKSALLRLLTRKDEVAQARQPGQGRREDLQCMREAADAYQTPKHSQTIAVDPSVFGASEHAKQEALAHHREVLQRLRERRENASTCEAETEDAKQTSWNEVGVELVTDENPNCACMAPVELAKYVCDAAGLTTEQRVPVALRARSMRVAYDAEVAKRATLTERQRRAEGIGASEHVTLPLTGRQCRMLLCGGGGCGKTRIINYVLLPYSAASMDPKVSCSPPSPTKPPDLSKARRATLS